MAGDWDLTEINTLAVDLGKYAGIAPDVARLAVRKTAADVKATAQAFCPVDTGFLRSSISYETKETRAGAEAEIGPTASYGHFLEWGTSRMAPRAFMGPALDRHGWQLEAALAEISGRFTP